MLFRSPGARASRASAWSASPGRRARPPPRSWSRRCWRPRGRPSRRRETSTTRWACRSPCCGSRRSTRTRSSRRGGGTLGRIPAPPPRAVPPRGWGPQRRPVRLPGGGMLIDDCYNANPQSAKAALLTLTHLVRGKGRAIAVLGDMLELGPTELDLHRDVGRFAAGAGLALLVCFGVRARAIGEGAREAGPPPRPARRFRPPPPPGRELCRPPPAPARTPG